MNNAISLNIFGLVYAYFEAHDKKQSLKLFIRITLHHVIASGTSYAGLPISWRTVPNIVMGLYLSRTLLRVQANYYTNQKLN